jgi:hypothetical protein
MDAKLKKIQITPMKFDKDGDVQKEEFSTLTIEIPMDSAGQREAIVAMLQLLSQEWVILHVEGKTPGAVGTA